MRLPWTPGPFEGERVYVVLVKVALFNRHGMKVGSGSVDCITGGYKKSLRGASVPYRQYHSKNPYSDYLRLLKQEFGLTEDPSLMAAFGSGEPTAQEVIEKVQATYRDLKTYETKGTVVSNFILDGVEEKKETSFHIRLKKPDLYLVTRTTRSEEKPGKSLTDAIWKDGSQAYTYSSSRNAYAKVERDRLNFAGVHYEVPPLFFPDLDLGFPDLPRMKDARIDRTEVVAGEECYVITGATEHSGGLTFWISKSRHFIVQRSEVIANPKIDYDLQLRRHESMKGRIPDELWEFGKKAMEESRKLFETHEIGGLSTETHTRTSTPDLSEEDFRFALPKDAALESRREVREKFLRDYMSGEKPQLFPEVK
ncbi:MAG: hypothetical protein O7H41_15790 [Planctomycetota bacterium]|nr:hypothetical protein [Planctomycetota bacterium]